MLATFIVRMEETMKKRWISVLLAAAIAVTAAAGCGRKKDLENADNNNATNEGNTEQNGTDNVTENETDENQKIGRAHV